MRLSAPLILVVSALLLPGCGSSSGSSPSTTSGGAPGGTAQPPIGPSGALGRPKRHGGSKAEANGQADHGRVPGDTSPSFQPRIHHDSGGGAAPFKEKGGDNSIEEAGSEGSRDEFRQAAAALHGYLDARAAGAWTASCRYLAAGVSKQLSQLTGASGGKEEKRPSCAEVIAGLTAAIPSSTLRKEAVADVGSLRVKGDSGFLLYKGAGGANYFIPVVREGHMWKVAAIAPSSLG